MTFLPQHFGLYFTPEHIQQAQSLRNTSALSEAWDFLDNEQGNSAIETMLLNAYRYRLESNVLAGEHAIQTLLQTDARQIPTSTRNVCAFAVTLIHCFEMVYDHPDFDNTREDWAGTFVDWIRPVIQTDQSSLIERLWHGLLCIASGIMLEDESLIDKGVQAYRFVVDEHIHPEGMIRILVENQGEEGYLRQLLAVGPMTLMAEAVSHVGLDLWHYNNRGVTLLTALSYLIYYYHFPEKWQWGEGLNKDYTQLAFQKHGAFIEMVNHHAQPRTVEALLEEQRPLFNAYDGGLTTLTHFYQKRKRGLFR